MSMALLIGLVRRTLNHSRILAPTGGTTTMGKAKSSLLQSSRKKLFCPKQTGKIKLGGALTSAKCTSTAGLTYRSGC
jgi:hypothetical protein